MKWVKCVYSGGSHNDLTIGKIYKVINHFPGDVSDERVEIINDNDVSFDFYVIDTDGIWFEDADAEVRHNKINQLGI